MIFIFFLSYLISLPGSFAETDLLKDEPAEKNLLIPTSVPAIEDLCSCVQKDKKAAMSGNGTALEAIAWCLDPAKKNDCSKNQTLYAEFLIAAATRGRLKAMFTLGMLYHFGGALPQDHRRAADWWAQSGRQNLAAGYFMLGQAYADGVGRPKSKQKALALMRRALKLGYLRAGDRIRELRKE
jgi:TPR repeat protein